jgi:hypothetical protein
MLDSGGGLAKTFDGRGSRLAAENPAGDKQARL